MPAARNDLSSGKEPAKATFSWLMIVAATAAVAALIAAWAILPVSQWISNLQAWVQQHGLLGHVLFALIYAAATVALAPGAPLTLAAGVAFGLAGFPATLAGATLGAALAFLIGRYVARSWVEELVSRRPTLAAVDRAIAAEGWKIVGLMRLSPLVPFNLQNYFFGVTPIGFLPYLVTTFFGIMPGTLLYVWIGSLGAVAGGGGNSDVSTAKSLAFGAGLVATLAVTVFVSWKANQILKKSGVGSGGAAT